MPFLGKLLIKRGAASFRVHKKRDSSSTSPLGQAYPHSNKSLRYLIRTQCIIIHICGIYRTMYFCMSTRTPLITNRFQLGKVGPDRSELSKILKKVGARAGNPYDLPKSNTNAAYLLPFERFISRLDSTCIYLYVTTGAINVLFPSAFLGLILPQRISHSSRLIQLVSFLSLSAIALLRQPHFPSVRETHLSLTFSIQVLYIFSIHRVGPRVNQRYSYRNFSLRIISCLKYFLII